MVRIKRKRKASASIGMLVAYHDDDKSEENEEEGVDGRLLATYATSSSCSTKRELMTDARDSPLSGHFLRRCEQCFV